MLPLALIATLAGVMLGLRFRVMALVPAIAAVSVLAFLFATAGSETVSFGLLTSAAAIASLQIGYFGGAMIRHVSPSSWTSERGNSLAVRR